jgi:hypothetical protein
MPLRGWACSWADHPLQQLILLGLAWMLLLSLKSRQKLCWVSFNAYNVFVTTIFFLLTYSGRSHVGEVYICPPMLAVYLFFVLFSSRVRTSLQDLKWTFVSDGASVLLIQKDTLSLFEFLCTLSEYLYVHLSWFKVAS